MGANQGRPVVFTDDVNLSHFRLQRVVGKGAFGKVRIVERKDTQLTFALKYIRKDEIVRSESVRNILRERRMMEHLHHPFICNLRYSFQDIEYMYIVLDLMNGGDLRFHISRKTFTEEAVRFWIAELGCALRYIHGQGIIHRDVKPDNVLLDSEGHVHLADFNVASDYTPGKLLTSKSGTLAYLAPEVYSGEGYGPGADWWSLGVLFYECIYNKRPFDGSTQSNLGRSIQQANPKFPVTSPPVSMSCMHAISSALEPDPAKRMGSESWQSFIDNPFFREIDFNILEQKGVAPVFVPSSEKTNFDATYDLEELLLEEAPLEARARRQKPREPLKDDATEKEIKEEEAYKLIEIMFAPFDYTKAAYEKISAGQIPSQLINTNTGSNSPTETTVSGMNNYIAAQTVSSRPQVPPTSHPNIRAIPSRTVSESSYQTPPGTNQPSPSSSPPAASKIRAPTSMATREANYRSHSQLGGPPNFSTPTPQNYAPTSYAAQNYSSGAGRSRHPSDSSRQASATGGINFVLGETGTWTDIAQRDNTLPADARDNLTNVPERPNGGIAGFFSRRRGRGHSPKPMERGILSGKEGGRVVVGQG